MIFPPFLAGSVTRYSKSKLFSITINHQLISVFLSPVNMNLPSKDVAIVAKTISIL